ncbi:hypothetical protein C8J56DRAFT_898228 [Mycena floridula]|nr:hypothetical protein C8J56DRAFT_898228 [Mycena floridula]
MTWNSTSGELLRLLVASSGPKLQQGLLFEVLVGVSATQSANPCHPRIIAVWLEHKKATNEGSEAAQPRRHLVYVQFINPSASGGDAGCSDIGFTAIVTSGRINNTG